MPKLESCATGWTHNGPIQWLCYWGKQPKGTPYTVAAVLVSINGMAYGYDLRRPDVPTFIGLWPMGGQDWQAKMRIAYDEMECALNAFRIANERTSHPDPQPASIQPQKEEKT